jgi:hypothetical protein
MVLIFGCRLAVFYWPAVGWILLVMDIEIPLDVAVVDDMVSFNCSWRFDLLVYIYMYNWE